MNLLVTIPVIIGACILIASLVPVWRLINQLPRNRMHRRWYFLVGLVLIFIVGYISYAVIRWNSHNETFDIVVTLVFFFGACFVYLVNYLALQTALDVRRMTILEHENIRDPLMGLYNRRYLERRLEEEIARARRYNLPLSIQLLDLDHFKQVNDSYGHQVGDFVLVNLAKLILGTIRESDIVARYGGEEIVIITPNTPAIPAGILADRLRQVVASTILVPAINHGSHHEIRITVSIGVACLSKENGDAQALFNCADKAMYKAKHEGRNQVFINKGAVIVPPLK
jgi:diguanylate cyclase (GGDEF)-like protein